MKRIEDFTVWPEDAIEEIERGKFLAAKALASLEPVDQEIVYMRARGAKLSHISARHRITRERVRMRLHRCYEAMLGFVQDDCP